MTENKKMRPLPPPGLKIVGSPDWKKDMDFELPISPRKCSSPDKMRADWERINKDVLSLFADKEVERHISKKGWFPTLPWSKQCPCCGSKKVEPVFRQTAWSTLRCDLKHMWWPWGGDPIINIDEASSSFKDCVGPDNFQAYQEIKAEVLLELLRKGMHLIQHAVRPKSS